MNLLVFVIQTFNFILFHFYLWGKAREEGKGGGLLFFYDYFFIAL